jgi:hypothetical protein
MRLDEHLAGAEASHDLAQRVPVGPRVVGHDSLDARDAVRGEVRRPAIKESRAGQTLLVGKNPGVGSLVE